METVEVVYDPDRITYSQLLDEFRRGDDPTRRPWSRQYASALLPLGEEQLSLAEEMVRDLGREAGTEIYTLIIPDAEFHPAEDYHQKYYLQNHDRIYSDVRAGYPRFEDLVASTRAGRINGYLGGCGSRDRLEKEIGDLGLSPEAQEDLRKRIHTPVGP